MYRSQTVTVTTVGMDSEFGGILLLVAIVILSLNTNLQCSRSSLIASCVFFMASHLLRSVHSVMSSVHHFRCLPLRRTLFTSIHPRQIALW